MRRWHISTTALCVVSITVEAETAAEAVAAAPTEGGAWEIGHSIVDEITLDDDTYEVTEVDALGNDIDTTGARSASPATAA